ncbi:MAG TPA: single-stranded DNA-binding protein [Solirubrobacteraceae bacterium]|jgi:single-strand DNA-binding protein|nr:single-stranded DNA-binding protein [Solirubrobacteraceae bacterium]
MSYASINSVVLVGRLTHDPELRELPSGQSVCDLRIVCNGIRRAADGEYHERPNYFDVAAFGGLGENVARYMRRGSLLAVGGRLEWREWENAEQQRRQAVKVVAENIQFLERRAADDEPASDGELGAAVESGVEGEPELVGASAGGLDLMF